MSPRLCTWSVRMRIWSFRAVFSYPAGRRGRGASRWYQGRGQGGPVSGSRRCAGQQTRGLRRACWEKRA
ncbi:hypothetical protein P175DRAFT_0124013 [Aspergillus ochraceoroseus IBT 24754]|uniref:Uncharacterized protein n=1 Tax=Aspergillus ochraceoroseus IBT 24754 TaxID=1392256 RepID=A0A2T5LKV5_9EURO|nr:uncharacterized protein P175DRAFT_0124013 [Aspergillus ochraceoroseus IBT 24754]PTU16905.1 hypothetical protein P175DRAFT_0124013 [Aspergillus ochraceoroseus IBT 24754]